MFAAALRESEQRDKAKRDSEQVKKDAEAKRVVDADALKNALVDARRELDRAIAAVRAAKQSGRSTVEADAVWKAAKARVIELETGERPTWAPTPAAEPDPEPDPEPDLEQIDESTGATDEPGSTSPDE